MSTVALAEEQRRVFHLTQSIPGFLMPGEGGLLFRLAGHCPADQVIVEIGSWQGKSTIWLGRGARAGSGAKVFAVDPHRGSPELKSCLPGKSTLPAFKKNLRLAGLTRQVFPVVKTSLQAAKSFDRQVGLLFVDGDHRYRSVLADFRTWLPKVAEGGIIAFHDTTVFPGVRRVVENQVFFSGRLVCLGLVSSIAYFRKVSRLTVKTRLSNRYLLFCHRVYAGLSGLMEPLRPPVWSLRLAKWCFSKLPAVSPTADIADLGPANRE